MLTERLVAAYEAMRAADEATYLQIIAELAAQPAENVHAVVHEYQNGIGANGLNFILVKVLRAIGYPSNEAAIHWLVQQIDNNAPSWEETIAAIAEIGPEMAVPHLVRAMWGTGTRDANWAYDVERICALLAELPEPAFAAGCGPTVAHLLALHHDPSQLDPGMLMDVFEKAGPSSAAYAIPALIDIFDRGLIDEFEKQARQLLSSYDADALRTYTLLLAQLGRP